MSASSGLPVHLSASGACTSSSGLVTPTGAGGCTLTATQSGDANRHAAPPVSQSFSVRLAAGTMYVLDPTAQRALSLTGSACAQATGSLYVNSSASTALGQSGPGCGRAAAVTAGGSIYVVGGSSAGCCSPTPIAPDAPVADPLNPIALPVFSGSGWTAGGVTLPARTVSGTTLQPGVYTGGIALTRGSYTLLPGIYVLDGGGFTVTGTATVSGSGVFIDNEMHGKVAACGSLTISGSATVTLSAPISGPYAQIALAQDRSCTSITAISGNSTVSVDGAIYTPGAAFTVTGNSSVTSPGHGLLVARTVQIGGQASISLNR